MFVGILAGVAVGVRSSAIHEPSGHEHCFAEWCVAPLSATSDGDAIVVSVRVRSDARQASQRPDHPQAWVVDAAGGEVGGPQRSLDRELAAGDSYAVPLTFEATRPGACPTFVVSEGGWPPFLGLGYAPSPFTSTVEWRVCELAGWRSAGGNGSAASLA